MDPHSSAYQARLEKLTSEFSAIVDYYSSPSDGGNYLGLLLKTMAELMKINFDRSNTDQYYDEVLKKYNKMLTHPSFKPLLEKDKALSVCFSFASMLGTFIEEMNDRPTEEPSALFQSVKDASVMDLKGVKISPMITRTRRSMTVDPPAIEHRPPTRAKSVVAVKRNNQKAEPETVYLDVPGPALSSLADRIEARAVRRVAATPLKQKTMVVGSNSGSQHHRKSERKRASSVADFDTTPNMMRKVVECAECGEKVKQSSLRRHMKGHGVNMGAKTSPLSVNSLYEGAFTEDDNEPLVKKAASIVPDLSKVKMEMESAEDEGGEEEEEEELAMADEDYEMLSEWMANGYKPVNCFSCYKRFPTFKSVSNHVYNSHGVACQNIIVFKCLGCMNTFRCYRGASAHVKMAITNNQRACKNQMIYCPETENLEEDISKENNDVERMDDDPRSPVF